MMGRVTDPVMAFDGLPCREMKGFLSFRLADDFLPENSGKMCIRDRFHTLRAVRFIGKEDIICSAENVRIRPGKSFTFMSAHRVG